MSRVQIAVVAVLVVAVGDAFSDDHVFQIRAKEDLTGFRVAKVSGIVTSLHGVVGAEQITATTTRKGFILRDKLEIRQVHIGYDLALLSSSELDALPKDGYTAQVDVDWDSYAGKTVQVIGYPLNIRRQIGTPLLIRDVPFPPLRNIVDAQSLLKLQDRRSPNPELNVISLAGYLLPGHSGAPIFDSNGHVIGVANGGLKGGTSGHGWAVPIPTDGWVTPRDNREFEKLAKKAPGILFKTTPDISDVREFTDHLKQLENEIADIRTKVGNRGRTGASILDEPSTAALYKLVVHPRDSMVIVTGNNKILGPSDGVTIQKKGEFRRVEITPKPNVSFQIKVWNGSSSLQPTRKPIAPVAGQSAEMDIELVKTSPNVNNLAAWQQEFGMSNTMLQRIRKFGQHPPNRRQNQTPRTKLPSAIRNR